VTADGYPAFLSRCQRLEAALAVQGAGGITPLRHLNTATLVTPTVRFLVPNYLTTNDER
jgi:hypothetical protein